MKNTTAILDDMRKITILTGEISSVHEQSLTKWPYIVFDNVKDVEIKYDLSKQAQEDLKGNSVDFYITLPTEMEDTSNIEGFDFRCKTLTLWVADMFWTDIKVSVFINDKLKYKSKEDESGLKQN